MGYSKPCVLRVEPLDARCLPSADLINSWNEELLKSIPINTAPVPMARNMAIVSVAMFDAVNSIDGSYKPYHADIDAPPGASVEAAAAQAAHDTLAFLYPSRKTDFFDPKLAADLAGIPEGPRQQGVAVGQEVAQQILALRANDRSSPAIAWTAPNNDPGTYQVTPPNNLPAANFHVQFITPFAIKDNSKFRPDAPPDLDSPKYAQDFNEVKVVGASNADEPGVDRDGNGLPDRTADQTRVALLWQAALGNHTVWNRIAQDRAAVHDLSLPETARMFALMNMALNDGLQTSYESKYHYNLWRPITAIHRADEDGNPATEAEAPIPGVPGSGWMTENPTTPPYPDYTSNASAIGAACATVLTKVFGKDDPFTVNWAQGPRYYANFWAAADEQADARVYGGIHFRFACEAGQQIGRDVGDYVVEKLLKPEHGSDDLTAAAAPTRTVHRALRDAQAERLLTQALARWEAAGVDTSALQGIDVRIADLGGLTLGQADDGVIWVDDNAAGWGWFVDRSPRGDSEFTRRGNQGERNRMDLLTVLEHEVGHLLGYDHAAGGVMQETLEAGVRRTMGPATLTAAERPGGAPSLFVWGGDTPWVIDGLVTGKRR